MTWENLNPRVTIAIYSIVTGRIRSVSTCDAFFVQQQMREGEDFVVVPEGVDTRLWLVRGGELVPRPGEEILAEDAANALRQLRATRDAKLRSEVDSLNALRLAAMTPDQIAAWTEYRQQLLDFPDTVEDVFNPNWPVAPAS